jgi:predicted AlkP superfamily pyrophosphatase or phosphodiesterase
MLVTTVTDELRLSTNFKAKTIAVSLKDRGAVLPGGHTSSGSFWYDGTTGDWITSSHYMNQLPDWLIKLNKLKLPDNYLNQQWNTILPIEGYTESIFDNNPYEGLFVGETNPVFPHKLNELKEKNGGYELLKACPWGNTFTFDFAKEAIKGEMLGKDAITDFLSISLSSTDYIGHQYGPISVEVEDTYIRLDKDIENFLSFLDAETGKGNYLVFLTADHGAVHVPAYLQYIKIPAGYFDDINAKSALDLYLSKKYGPEKWVLNVSNEQVFLNKKLIYEKNIDLKEFKTNIKNILLEMEGVAHVFSSDEIESANFGNNILKSVQNGYYPTRSGDIVFVLKPGWVEGMSKTGTTHGAAYTYDTHVPLLFYGWKTEKGNEYDRVNITDIAPTISMLLDISLPNGTTGSPIKSYLNKIK